MASYRFAEELSTIRPPYFDETNYNCLKARISRYILKSMAHQKNGWEEYSPPTNTTKGVQVLKSKDKWDLNEIKMDFIKAKANECLGFRLKLWWI